MCLTEMCLPCVRKVSFRLWLHIVLLAVGSVLMNTQCISNKESQVAQMVKNMIAMQETWVQPLGWKDPLEKKIATHCSILVWEIPWTELHGGLQSMELQRI